MSSYYITENTSSTKEFSKSFESLLPGSKVHARHPKTGFTSSGDGIISKDFYIGNNLTKYLGEIEIQNSSSCILSIPKTGSYSVSVSNNPFQKFTKQSGGIVLPTDKIIYRAESEIVDDLIIIMSMENLEIILKKDYFIFRLRDALIKIDAKKAKVKSVISFIESTLKTARNFKNLRDSILAKTNFREICSLLVADLIAESLGISPINKNSTSLLLVKKAEEFIDEECNKLFTIHEIANKLNTIPRTLQQSFKKYREYTPMQYLKKRKLYYAHKLLLNSGKNDISVKSAALNAGMLDLNRFSKYYFEMFRELPSTTLKKGTNN
jgi:AraC-like DNA-binding protein